jgi:tRNA (cytidine/uridine-2'-O-)-methyltransferase
MMIEIALFQPDIAPNAATILRMAACFGLKVRIIEPAGFVWSDSSFRRAGMDYLGHAEVERHRNWEDFVAAAGRRRMVLVTTKGSMNYTEFAFAEDDILLMGRETAGVPDYVHRHAGARLLIPMRPAMRSLNVALACAMVTGEALRQTAGFPVMRQSA